MIKFGPYLSILDAITGPGSANGSLDLARD